MIVFQGTKSQNQFVGLPSGEADDTYSVVQICVPTLSQESGPNPEWESIDVCVGSPGNGVYMPGQKHGIDPPMAYFPLTGAITDSWPFPRFKSAEETGARFVDDDVFGSVLDCRMVTTVYPSQSLSLGQEELEVSNLRFAFRRIKIRWFLTTLIMEPRAASQSICGQKRISTM